MCICSSWNLPKYPHHSGPQFPNQNSCDTSQITQIWATSIHALSYVSQNLLWITPRIKPSIPEIPNSYLLKRNEKHSNYFGDRQDQLSLANKPECWIPTLSTNRLSHPGNQTNISTMNTNIPAILDCTKGQAFQLGVLLEQLRAQIKTVDQCPRDLKCKESLSCGKITNLKQAQKSFLFNAWIKHPRHRGHYCRWLWFPTAQHTSRKLVA